MTPLVSAVIPMHNEQENAEDTLAAIAKAFADQGWTYELIPVNDGSTDDTADVLQQLSLEDSRITPVSYHSNRGRGYALRQGFACCRGQYVVSMDADLSYTPEHAVRMISRLIRNQETDVVIASPYMPGGAVEGVPFIRLLVSKAGNLVLQHALPQRIFTSTGIARAYRADALRCLELSCDGKEIHLEILSGALALGFQVTEMPATLRSRKKGHSKFRPRRTMHTHLVFTLLERATTLFAFFGALMIAAGFMVGLNIAWLSLTGSLNSDRPAMTLLVLLVIGGFVSLSFALMSMQMTELRRSVIRLQANRRLRPHPAGRLDVAHRTMIDGGAIASGELTELTQSQAS